MNREMPRTGTLHSAVYEGRLAHLRHGPTPHAFDYRIAQLMLDLDEIDEVFRGRWLWWSTGAILPSGGAATISATAHGRWPTRYASAVELRRAALHEGQGAYWR